MQLMKHFFRIFGSPSVNTNHVKNGGIFYAIKSCSTEWIK